MLYRIFALIVCFGLVACSDNSSVMIEYLEESKYDQPFTKRMIVTSDYIRFDDGEGSEDYLIYDRKNERAYNIVYETKSVLVVNKKDTQVEPPFELVTGQNKIDMSGAPAIEGINPVHYQYTVNGRVCVETISVQGLMPDAVKAIEEFYLMLATDSAMTFNQMPADMHDPCLIAKDTFLPTLPYANGLPIREWSTDYARTIMNYDANFTVTEDMFKLPEDYFYYTMMDFREGRVDWDKRKVYSDEEIDQMIKQQQSPSAPQ